jgi:hypothetical protein
LRDWLRDVEAVFKWMSGRTEGVLDYLDDRDGEALGTRDSCVADVEAIHREANYMVGIIARAALWLKLGGN